MKFIYLDMILNEWDLIYQMMNSVYYIVHISSSALSILYFYSLFNQNFNLCLRTYASSDGNSLEIWIDQYWSSFSNDSLVFCVTYYVSYCIFSWCWSFSRPDLLLNPLFWTSKTPVEYQDLGLCCWNAWSLDQMEAIVHWMANYLHL